MCWAATVRWGSASSSTSGSDSSARRLPGDEGQLLAGLGGLLADKVSRRAAPGGPGGGCTVVVKCLHGGTHSLPHVTMPALQAAVLTPQQAVQLVRDAAVLGWPLGG